ncbi:F-box protein At3g07870-like [Benincasa hispida]|uniref:F-box protein At3g07870-like n=1 Tax=Benincasa hispida TaxID=102211 RepID=UPI0019008DE1|nr:F-box protein At3g07870-like [Benincasa hispida]
MESMKLGRGLPRRIVREIFSKLVISDLPNLRLISKTWNDMVLDYANSSHHEFLTNAFFLSTCDNRLDPRNLKMHCIRFDTTKHLDVDFDLESEWTKSSSLCFDGEWTFMAIMNYCSGLLLICKCANYTRCDGIFNPMTNEFLQVPRGQLDNDIYYFGFGFTTTTKQYKLFRVCDSFSRNCEFESGSIMDVLTFSRSGTNANHNQWRYLHYLPLDIHSNGAYLNGFIYWIGKEEEKENEYAIYVLDVETEKIELSIVLEICPPLCTSKVGGMQQFNDSVYAIFLINQPTGNSIQVWRMQEKDLWIREFVVDDIPNDWNVLTLIKAFEDGEILCMVNFDFFCWYNPLTGRKKIITKNEKKIRYVCQIQSLNFGYLPNILAGDPPA